ncbi:hypothetical protein [Allomuricauda sp.]|jgi:hypothetical protein|uniref:hypothetical protein n=1 Tax=Flagellimonas alginolytica TaxID=3177515 RepID=UPI0025F8641D|nr:hypothetical protein [Allomuricauda sp.]
MQQLKPIKYISNIFLAKTIMKTIRTVLIIQTVFCLVACNPNNRKNQEQGSTQPGVSNTPSESFEENKNSLLNKTPLTKEQFASWLPETMLGLPLTSSTINLLPGVGSCTANYSQGNTRIRIMIIDGAGEKGANGVAPYRATSTLNIDDKGAWGSTKTETVNGLKAKVSYLEEDRLNASMFYNERFAVDIKLNELTRGSLDQIAQELKLEKLKEIALQ